MVTTTQAAGLAVAARTKSIQNAATRKLWLPARIRQREVMASPPTITVSTSHTIASPRGHSSVQNNSGVGRLNPIYRYRKGSSPARAGTGTPDNGMVRLNGVNYGATVGADVRSNLTGVAILTDASEIEFQVKANTHNIWFKIDGQYVSLTPTAVAGSGAITYLYMNLTTSVMREIEMIADTQLYFGGVYTSQIAGVYACPPRGPRVIVQHDSFGESSGATYAIHGWIQIMADALGWDDVRPAAVGATGMVNDAVAAKMAYTGRVTADVVAYSPDVVILAGSVNDNATYTAAQVTTAAQSLINTIRTSLPNCVIVLTSPCVYKGPGGLDPTYYLKNDALAALALANGLPFINLLDQAPFETFDRTNTTTLAALAAQSATTISVTDVLCPGATYKFADGTRFQVKSISGGGPFSVVIDACYNAQSNGAVITPCGNSLWSGLGKAGSTTGFGNCDVVVSSDGTHPTDAGHTMIGTAMAFGMMGAL